VHSLEQLEYMCEFVGYVPNLVPCVGKRTDSDIAAHVVYLPDFSPVHFGVGDFNLKGRLSVLSRLLSKETQFQPDSWVRAQGQHENAETLGLLNPLRHELVHPRTAD